MTLFERSVGAAQAHGACGLDGVERPPVFAPTAFNPPANSMGFSFLPLD